MVIVDGRKYTPAPDADAADAGRMTDTPGGNR